MIYELLWRPAFIVLQAAAVLLPPQYVRDEGLLIADNIERRPYNDYELDVLELGWLSNDATMRRVRMLRKVRVRANCYYMDEGDPWPESCYYVRVGLGEWTGSVP